MVFAIPFEKPQKIQAVIWGHAFLSFFLPSAELAALYMYSLYSNHLQFLTHKVLGRFVCLFVFVFLSKFVIIQHGATNSVYGKICMGEWVKIKYNLHLLHLL